MRRTKIVCTIGPATSSPEMIEGLISKGMNVARLNFSHGTHEYHKQIITNIREISARINKPVAIMQDLQGPKIRIGKIKDGETLLKEGEIFLITVDDVAGDSKRVSTDFKVLPEHVRKGDRLLLDDGLIELSVISSSKNEIQCRVVAGGILRERKGINIPQVDSGLPSLTEKDVIDLKFGLAEGVDYLAISFVRRAKDVLEFRKLITQQGRELPIIAKIEKSEAIENLDDIVEVSDGLMVARGDLGVEISPERVPLLQKMMIKKCNNAFKPVITATQMLESMVSNPRPTRAETSDVANAILDGSDAIMLSAETAIGKYPLQAVEMMNKIAIETETQMLQVPCIRDDVNKLFTVSSAISHATFQTASDLNAKLIITFTQSGSTARMVSHFRPGIPVLAVTPEKTTLRRLSLIWGVEAILIESVNSTDDMIIKAEEAAQRLGLAQEGDLVVITAGVPVGIPGTTNMLKVHRLQK